ncbi:MAG: hypothetical protein ACLFUG_07765 [Nitriliruptoraceae bacterium]
MSDQGRVERRTDGSIEMGGQVVSFKLILAVLIVVGVTFFVFQNTESVALTWLFLEFTMPLWGMALVLLGVGMLLGWALQMRRNRRRSGR